MFREIVLLVTLACAVAASDYLRHFQMEKKSPRPHKEPEQRVLKYPSDTDVNDSDFNDDDFNDADLNDANFNDADSQKPTEESQYKLLFSDYQVPWESFKIDHNKQYATKDEETHRNNIFLENLKLIESHNLKYRNGETSFYLGINHFADLTIEEHHKRQGFEARRSSRTDSTCNVYYPTSRRVLPSVDWRKRGYVSAIKNQGNCGCCYAFSIVGAIEGQWFKKTGKIINFSEQQIVDCSQAYGNDGCNGGYTDVAFQYVADAGGIENEGNYPYMEVEEPCSFNQKQVKATINSCSIVQPIYNETALKIAIGNIGPISTDIDAAGDLFRFYEGGIYNNRECNPFVTNHAVLIVGYGTEDGRDFWIVKNSWSRDWGESGYIRMSRNMDNQCGIACKPVFPNV